MGILNRFTTSSAGTPPWISYRGLSALFGVATLVAFGTERLLYETVGLSIGDVPAYVLGGVVLGTGVSSFYASIHDQGIKTGVLLALGPVGGFAVYLIGYHLVLPPSTDSPTWLVFLAFAGGFIALGVVMHLVGRLIRNVV